MVPSVAKVNWPRKIVKADCDLLIVIDSTADADNTMTRPKMTEVEVTTTSR